jgi:hypothetical protein
VVSSVQKRTDWTTEWGDVWSRKLNGLLLRVSPDPDNPDEPWTWEVLSVEDEFTDYEVGLGGAVSREVAMAAAEAAALSPEGNA